MKSVKVVLVFQSLLGIYGDRGNATVINKRLQWRGIPTQLVEVEPGEEVPDDAQIYLLGGGEDAAQVTAVELLAASGGLQRALGNGAALLAVCAGFQIVGNSFTVGEDEQKVTGLGLLDVTTVRGKTRAVGEILTSWHGQNGSQRLLTGFENHGGYTTVGSAAAPLAAVEVGVGNRGDGTEGAVQGKVIGTYLHGPVLARNPALADHLIELALGEQLEPLTHADIEQLRAERLAAVRG